jgi:hypothetical protein
VCSLGTSGLDRQCKVNVTRGTTLRVSQKRGWDGGGVEVVGASWLSEFHQLSDDTALCSLVRLTLALVYCRQYLVRRGYNSVL